MKVFRRLRRWFSKSCVWIAVHVLALILVVVFYLVNVFIDKKPPAENLIRILVVALALIVSLCRIIWNRKKLRERVQKVNEGTIGNAFEHDKKSKKLLIRALCDYSEGDPVAYMKKLMKLKSKATTRQERQAVNLLTASTLQAIGESKDAFALYTEILAENPDCAPALNNLCVYYFEKGDYKKAIEYKEKAISLGKITPKSYDMFANAYFRIFNLEKAEEYALMALEQKNGDYFPISLLAIIYAVQGNVLKSKNYADTAVSYGQNQEELKEAIKIYKEKYAHYTAVEARSADWKNRTGIPSIHFTLDGQFVKSIIGGQINEPAPVSAFGQKMRLLAAFFCSEFPENDIFPKRGVLRFYIAPNNQYGASLDHHGKLNQQKEFRVLFDEDEFKFSTSAYYGASDELFPVHGSYRPRFIFETDAMACNDFRFGDTVKRLLEAFENDENIDEAYYHEDDFICGIDTAGHKMGGYPYFTQEDPRGNDIDYSRYDTLLFQLDSDYSDGDIKVMFGDSGVCNFFIPAEKLKSRDFSDILYTWDCC